MVSSLASQALHRLHYWHLWVADASRLLHNTSCYIRLTLAKAYTCFPINPRLKSWVNSESVNNGFSQSIVLIRLYRNLFSCKLKEAIKT